MARPRSDERRTAILSAATRVVATQGLGAPTATIAREAGVSNGSLFLYFETKSALLNELYVVLKTETGAAATTSLPDATDALARLQHMWTHWLRWATENPQKRRALALLEVADDITAESRARVQDVQRGMAEVLEQARAAGPMRDVPLGFVLDLVTAMADATIDTVIRDPGHADERTAVAFDAIWRVLAGSSDPTTV